MVKVFSVNYQSLLKCTNCYPSSVILSHQCQKMSKEVWQVCDWLQGVLKGAGVQCKQKETPNRSMDGQNRRTLRGLHQAYLKTMAHTFLSQFVGVVVTSLWSHLCLLWWSWFISARCFFQLTKTRKNHWNRRDMVVLTIEEQIPTCKLSTRFFKFLMVLLWIIYSNMKTFTLHFIFGNHFIHSHDLCVLWGSVIAGHYWEGIKNFAGDYQSNSAQHSMTSIKTFVCSKITVCRRCIIAVSWSENRADVKI